MTDKEAASTTPQKFMLSDAKPVESGTATAPSTGRFMLADAKLIESSEDYTIRNSQRLGIGPDKKLPIYNIQKVEPGVRLVSELFHDSADEKITWLKSKLGDTYDYGTLPRDPNKVILKKKGDKYWGVVDQANMSLEEMVPEVMENLDIIAQLASIPAGMISGGLTAGGIQGLRQLGKKILNPDSSVNKTGVVVDTAAGVLTGGIGSGTTAAVKRGAQESVSLLGKGIQKASGAVDDSLDGGILSKVGQKLNITETPEFIAKEIGGSAKQLDPTRKNLLVDKISKLKRDHPEFVDAYKGAWTLKGKFENLAKLHDEAGSTIGQLMEQYKDQPIKIGDILRTKSFADLSSAAKTRLVKKGKSEVRVDRETKLGIQKIQKGFLEDLGAMVLGEGDISTNAIMNQYRKGILKDTDLAKQYGAKTNDQALISIIADKEISLGDAWALRLGRDDIIKYGKQKGQITSKNTANKFTADAVREAMADSILALPEGQALLKAQDLYSDLYPILSTMGGKLGQDASSTWNPLRILPGTLNSAPRYAARLGVNLANKMEVRAFLEGLSKSGLPLPADASINVAGKSAGALVGQLSRAAKFNFIRGWLDKDAEAQALPRDAQAYFENPDFINELGNSIDDPDLMDAMVKQFERGDADGFSNMLSMVASENDQLFDNAPYKSLVVNNGKPIIMDKYEREQYRKFLEKTITDPRDLFDALQAVNGDNVMTTKPFEPPPGYMEIKKGKATPSVTRGKVSLDSTISKTANSLKKADTVQFKDGTERKDYSY